MLFFERPDDFKNPIEVVGCHCVHDGTFLLLKRHPEKIYGNVWGAPSGKVDPGETFSQAMLRELYEETDIAVSESQLHLFKTCYVTYTDGKNYIYHLFDVIFDKKPSVTVHEKEHTEFCWVTPQQALALDLIEEEDAVIHLYFDL